MSLLLCALSGFIVTGFVILRTGFHLWRFSTLNKELGDDFSLNNELCQSVLPSLNASRFHGCEDMSQFDDGLLVISCADRRPQFAAMSSWFFDSKSYRSILADNPFASGMWLMTDSQSTPQLLDIKCSQSFSTDAKTRDEKADTELCQKLEQGKYGNTHGLDVFQTSIGQRFVYVVNHRTDGESVEIYELDTDKLQLLLMHRIKSRLFSFLNDVVPLPLPDHHYSKAFLPGFVVSNSYNYDPLTIPNLLESMLLLPATKRVVYCASVHRLADGSDASETCKTQFRLTHGSGLAVSSERQFLFLVDTMDQRLYQYEVKVGAELPIDPTFMGLESNANNGNVAEERHKVWFDLTAQYETGQSSCDKLQMLKIKGQYIVRDVVVAGCHPRMLQTAQYLLGNEPYAASQVTVMRYGDFEPTTVYYSDGKQFPASSVAIVDLETSTLLLGSLTAPGIYRCKVEFGSVLW